MSDQSMVERVAGALVKEMGYGDQMCDRAAALSAAHAAITAMREPTEAMLEASGAGYEEIFHKAEYAEMWRTMIDSALKP